MADETTTPPPAAAAPTAELVNNQNNDQPKIKLYWYIHAPPQSLHSLFPSPLANRYNNSKHLQLTPTHRLEQSRSQRILWLLESLSLPYELIIFHRNPKTRLAPPELKEIHALGKSPVISVLPAHATAEDKPVVIAESANIIEYLLEHFGKESTLLPKRWREGKEGMVAGETEEWLRYRYFMHYTEGSLMVSCFLFRNRNLQHQKEIEELVLTTCLHLVEFIVDGYRSPQYVFPPSLPFP